MHRFYLLILCLMMALVGYATQTVQGVVLDLENQPLQGVLVYANNTKTSATTDNEGNFTIEVIAGDKLTFSLWGFRTITQGVQEVMVVNLKPINKNNNVSKSAKISQPKKVVNLETKENNQLTNVKSQSTNTNVAQQQTPKRPSYYDNWRMFIMGNIAYSPLQQKKQGISGYGLTVGMVKTGGWYASFMMGPEGIKTPQYADSKNANDYLYTGQMKVSRLSGTFGFLAGKAVYFYGGVGYGRRSLLCEAYNLDGIPQYWVPMQSRTSILNGAMFEAGLLADIKGFAITVGANYLTDFKQTGFWELKFGIGGCFKVK